MGPGEAEPGDTALVLVFPIEEGQRDHSAVTTPCPQHPSHGHLLYGEEWGVVARGLRDPLGASPRGGSGVGSCTTRSVCEFRLG